MKRFYLLFCFVSAFAAIPFSGDLSQQKFFVPGIKLGLNYNLK
jgi:hypothetical protein